MAALRSKGAILLSRVALGQAEKALRVGVNRVTLNRWEGGHTRPPAELRARVCELWGIPDEAWNLLPSDPDPPGMPVRDPADDGPLLDDELGALSMTPEGRIAEIERALDQARAEAMIDPEGARRKVDVLDRLMSAALRVAKAQGTFELGVRLFRLPIYQRLASEIRELLKPCPACMRRVADGLQKLEEENGR